MTPLQFNWPVVVASSPSALRTATNALCRHYILPETLLHPVVIDQADELARLLPAYGLVPTEPQPVTPQELGRGIPLPAASPCAPYTIRIEPGSLRRDHHPARPAIARSERRSQS
jgi:hypothetical protein